MTGPPDAAAAVVVLEASNAAHVGVFCDRRHHRLARLYATPAGVLVDVLVRGQRASAQWLAEPIAVAPVCTCAKPVPVTFVAELFKVMAGMLEEGPANVDEFRILWGGFNPLLFMVDRQHVVRLVELPSVAAALRVATPLQHDKGLR